MSAEIVTIGTELLLGLSRNTNAEWITERLASIGVEVHYQTVVGDDSGRLVEVLRAAAHRARVVIATGGLGPTPDDLTRKAIATVFRRRLVLDQTVLDQIRARFASRGIPMPPINEAQALIPKDSAIIENPMGTAPGLHFRHQETDLFALPGVSSEMQAMMDQYVLPHLRASHPGTRVGRLVVRTIGLPESLVAERLAAIEIEEPRIRIGYLPGRTGVDVVLGAATPDAAWLGDALDRLERRVRATLGPVVYGADDENLPEVFGRLIVERSLTVATAESVTAGSLGAAITAAPGSSRYYRGGIVAYANDAKRDLLGVSEAILRKHGAVSEAVAAEMAAGARTRLQADLGLATTGIAGPDGGTESKPVGLVFLGLASEEDCQVERHRFSGSRAEIVARATQYALDLARRHLMAMGS